jgi:tellurite resistance-related uncharacterized protein
LLIELALSAGLLPASGDIEGLLEDIAESIDDRQPTIYDVLFLTRHAQRTGVTRWLELAVVRLSMSQGVGAFHAWEQLMIAARIMGADTLHGVQPPQPWHEIDADNSAEANLQAALASLERRLSPENGEFARLMSRLLGGGLPLDGIGDLEVAQLCRFLERTVEWQVFENMHTELGQWIADRRRRLLADQPSDEVLAWLLW